MRLSAMGICLRGQSSLLCPRHYVSPPSILARILAQTRRQWFLRITFHINHCLLDEDQVELFLTLPFPHSLGADVIYDPSCLPHLVRVLSALLKRKQSCSESGPVAYISSVIRNIDTFNYFFELAEKANLLVTDLTEMVEVSHFLPYLRSYDRPSIHIFRIHV